MFDAILAFIEADHLDKAIEELKKATKGSSKFMDVVSVAAWYNDFSDDANAGELSFEQKFMEKNRIRRALLQLLPDEQEAPPPLAPVVEIPIVETSPIKIKSTSQSQGTKASDDDFFNKYVKRQKMRFFEAISELPPLSNRTYGELFPKNQTRYIWWEVEVVCLPPKEDVSFDLTFFYYTESGDILGGQAYSSPMTFPKMQTAWVYYWAWGYEQPGSWAPGAYRVEVYAGTNLLAAGNFKIV